jgi:serine/threonine protein kinase/Tfp pilus assembly protein PilF
MKCPKCDADTAEDSRFCSNCGARLVPYDEGSISETKPHRPPDGQLTTGSAFAGKYRVIGEIGRGGMAVVYKAEDTNLKRLVALKLLSPNFTLDGGAKERFVREAQAASALDHSNICTIYEIDETRDGQMFIAMSYCEGGTLGDRMRQGPFTSEEVVAIAIQIAEGLADAHEGGIIHRDIKPANIMMTPKGQVKITDFGLAKLSGGERITEIGVPMGTVTHMSPEQVRGEEVDQRTDIWSLGIVLYEMITGSVPFKGENAQAVIYSILNVDPEPITNIHAAAPTQLESIISKALTKKPDFRYQNAGDLLTDLRKVKKGLKSEAPAERGPASRRKPSIAVLPFVDMSPEKDQEYFCDGMAEELINALANLEGLQVASRTSTFQFKGKGYDIGEVGRALKVQTVLEGSVRKAGNRLRITAQLVSVADGYHLWSDKYDREIEDIFAIQDDISLAIVDNLKIRLLGGERAKLTKRHTEDLDAYSLYLRGRWLWNRRTEKNLEKAIDLFRQAIAKDPDYAQAYVGLAESYIALPDYSPVVPREPLQKAKEAALKALEIDDTLPEAHVSLASFKMNCEWDWEGAECEFKRSIELNPGYATAHHWYGLFLTWMARFEEAIKEIKRAQELDPGSLVISRNIGLVFYHARQYDQAIEMAHKTIEMDPGFSTSHALLGCAYLQKSMYDEALAEIEKEKAVLNMFDSDLESYTGVTYAAMGEKPKARKVLAKLVEKARQLYVSPYILARICVALGEVDGGFKWLDEAYQDRDRRLIEIKVDPMFDGVRSDPRLAALLDNMGLGD